MANNAPQCSPLFLVGVALGVGNGGSKLENNEIIQDLRVRVVWIFFYP